jgi:ribosome-associated translation inhibitor RaiA
MKVQFRSMDPDGARLRGRVLQRVSGVMRWLRSFVGRVDVRLDDVNGPLLPGVDKRCQLQARLPDGRVARIEATSRSWTEAVELAIARLRQRVVYDLHRAAVTERMVLAPALAPALRRAPVVHRLAR